MVFAPSWICNSMSATLMRSGICTCTCAEPVLGARANAKAKVVKISLKTDRVSCNGATKVSQRIDSVLCYFLKLLTCLLQLHKKRPALMHRSNKVKLDGFTFSKAFG